MKLNILFSVSIFLFIALGCANTSTKPAITEEGRARIDFANKISESYPFRVSFSAQGQDREILDISVIEAVPAYSAEGTIELIVDDELKRNAKKLKFTEIHIEGGRKSFGDLDTINRTISLRDMPDSYKTDTTTVKPATKPKLNSEKSATVISSGANLYASPGYNADVIKPVPQSSTVTIKKQRGAWFLVDSSGQEGWMHGNSIKFDK